MKKNLLMSALLLTLFGGLTLGVAACDSGKKPDDTPVVPTPPVEPDVITKALIADTSKMKTNYYVDDLFDPSGLEVRLVTTKNGVKDEGVLTTDYTLSIQKGAALKTSDTNITVTSTATDVTGTSFEITVSENQVYKYLVADTSKMKTNYYVGETLDTTGLVVTMFTDTNGVVDEGVAFEDYTLSIKSDKKLATTDTEVIVKSNEKGILSTQFSISVKPKPILTSLYDYVSFIVETNNYTVTSQIGQSNNIKGLVTANGVQWTSSDDSYFLDIGVGYAEYKGNTFRFKNPSGKITNQAFISDLGGNAIDFGLFDPRTVDEFADNRISNYSIKGITKAELNYLKTVKAVEDNPNRFEIDIHHSKWLWNAIAHTQLTRDPVEFLDKGLNSGRIFVELIDGGLKVNLVPPVNGFVDSCTATISAIGETEIPGLNEFLANPTFPGSRLDLNLLSAQKLVRDNNYTVSNEDASKVALYTKDYSYGACLDTEVGHPKSTIYLEEGNTLNYAEGYYNIKNTATGFEVIEGDIDPSRTTYLTSFDIWNLLTKYFVKTSENHYKYTVAEVLGQNPQITSFIPNFLDVDIDTDVLKEVLLTINFKGASIDNIEFEVIGDQGSLGKIIVNNFGTTRYEPLENYLKTLY